MKTVVARVIITQLTQSKWIGYVLKIGRRATYFTENVVGFGGALMSTAALKKVLTDRVHNSLRQDTHIVSGLQLPIRLRVDNCDRPSRCSLLGFA